MEGQEILQNTLCYVNLQDAYNNNLKMDDYSSSSQYCFWDAKSEGDAIILMINSAMALGVLLIASYRLFNLFKFEQLDRQKRKTLLQIHGLIFVWAIMFLIQNAYSIAYFYIDLKDLAPDDITEYSQTYALLDKIPSFLVRTIFLKICFFYYDGFMCKIQAKNFTIRQIKFFKWLNLFFWARMVIQGIGMLGFIIFERGIIWTVSTINVVIVLLDSLLTCIAQIYSLLVFLNKYDLLDRLQEYDKLKLKREFYVMIGTGVIGFIVNLIFLIIRPLFGDIGKCMDPFQDHLPFSITHNILGFFILNFVPLIWILKMYSYIRHPSIIQTQITDNLLQ